MDMDVLLMAGEAQFDRLAGHIEPWLLFDCPDRIL